MEDINISGFSNLWKAEFNKNGIDEDIESYLRLLSYIDDKDNLNKTKYVLLCTNNKEETKRIFRITKKISQNLVFQNTISFEYERTFEKILSKSKINCKNNEVLFTFIDEGLDFSDDNKYDYDRFIECTESLNKVIIIGLYNPYGEDCELKEKNNIINKLNEKRKEYKEFNFYTFDKVVEKEKDIADKTPQSKENDNEVNVLLLAMSTLSQPNERQVGRYLYKTNEIEGSSIIEGYYVSQMEPVPKMLAELLNSKKDKLDKIFVLNTNKTKDKSETNVDLDKIYIRKEKSAFDYFKNRCSFVDETNIVDVNSEEDDNGLNIERALCNFYFQINDFINENKKINLYVDIHGGLRDSFLIVDAILMLFKDMENIELKNIYTVEYENGESIIKDCKDRTINIFNFVNGMNEFLNYGRSKGLVEFDNKNGNQNKDLVEAINEISNGILFNQTDIFKTSLSNLQASFKQSNNDYFDIFKEMIKKDYKVIVNGTEYNLLSGQIAIEDFPGELQWCLNKKHYQQALVLIESLTYEYLNNIEICSLSKKGIFDKNKIEYKNINNEWDEWMKRSFGKCFKKIKNEKPFNNLELEEGEKFYDQYGQLNEPIIDNKIDTCRRTYKMVKPDGREKEIPCKEKNKDIPLEKKVESRLLEEIHRLMYIYNCLKIYRNTVSHASQDLEKDIKTTELEAWMQFYINQLEYIKQECAKI